MQNRSHLIFLIVLVMFLLIQCLPKNDNVLDILNKTYNFNKAKKGSIVTSQFIIKNNSDKEIIINAIKVECSCTNSERKIPFTIKAGKSDTLYISYDTSESELGYQKKSAVIKTNSAVRLYSLKIVGNLY